MSRKNCRWLMTVGCLAACFISGLLNLLVVLLFSNTPNTILLAVISVLPFVCMALLAFVSRQAWLSSWLVIVVATSVSAYDWYACNLCYDFHVRSQVYDEVEAYRNKGRSVGGMILGFALYVTWPATLLCGTMSLVGWTYANRHNIR